MTEVSRAADEARNLFFEGINVGLLEDYYCFGHLLIPKRDVLTGSSGSSLIPKLGNRFPTPSVDPDWKKTIMFTVSTDTKMLFERIGVASYLHSLVAEEHQVKINEVDAPSLFNEI